MRKGNFQNRRVAGKVTVLLVAVAILVIGAVGGTAAWLAAKSNEVQNTFTHGDITVDLTDAVFADLKMVPGKTFEKTATVTVAEGSEPCYVYIKVEKSENFDDFMNKCELDSKWIPMTGEAGVYYYDSDPSDAKVEPVNALEEAKTAQATVTVQVKETVTKADFDAIQNAPNLKLTAYAVQSENMTDVVAAWEGGSDDASVTGITP